MRNLACVSKMLLVTFHRLVIDDIVSLVLGIVLHPNSFSSRFRHQSISPSH